MQYVKKKTHKNVFEALHKIKQGPPPSTDIKLIDIEYLKLHGHRYLYITAGVYILCRVGFGDYSSAAVGVSRSVRQNLHNGETGQSLAAL